jgi:pimeloyl-ACP methyl ester carboxylesterase
MLNRRLIDTAAGSVAAVDEGEGPVALFVHGVFASADLWRRVLAPFSSERRCIALDLPGHGRSPLPEGQDVSVGAIAELVEALCGALELDAVDLVGNDTGGAVCQVFAARHPERIRTLTLTNCDTAWNMPPADFLPIVELARRGEFAPRFVDVANDPERARAQGLGPGYERPDEVDADLIEAYVQPFKSPEGARALERVVAAIDPRDLVACQEELAALTAPTLLVWGTGDQFFPLEDAYRLRDTIAGARDVVELEGAKLFFPDERADELVPLLRRQWQSAVPA